jgi:hypothetical protein
MRSFLQKPKVWDARAVCFGAAAASMLTAGCAKQANDVAPATADRLGDIPMGEAAAAPIQLTDNKLNAYLAYQRRMLAIYGGALDAGSSSAIPKLAEAEEEARKQSHLERAELTAIGEMVREVIGKRIYGAPTPGDNSLERMKALQTKMSGERREELARSISQLEASRNDFARMTEERKKYGDANVDLLLAHEAELARAWKDMMASFAPR